MPHCSLRYDLQSGPAQAQQLWGRERAAQGTQHRMQPRARCQRRRQKAAKVLLDDAAQQLVQIGTLCLALAAYKGQTLQKKTTNQKPNQFVTICDLNL